MTFETTRMTRAAGVVASATLLSRLLGYARDMAIAWVFGAGLHSDAFIAAFRIPNLLRRLFGEGAFSMAFIPVFSETLAEKGRVEAMKLAATVLRYLFSILVVMSVLGIWVAPVLVRAVAPGFWDDPEKFLLTLHLTRIMLPYLFFVGMLALAMGILNGVGVFAPPAMAPICLNLTMLAAVGLGWFLASDSTGRAIWLAAGVLIGGLIQLGLQVPFLGRSGLKPGLGSWRLHSDLLRISRMLLPAVFGTAVFQINILVGTLLGSLLGDGSVSYLFFADRLVQFPLGIFAMSAATASLPSFSRQAGQGDMDGLRRTLDYGLRHVLFVMFPAMAGLMVLGEPIVALLFEHGAFGREASELTAQALLWYASGIWAVAAVRVAVPVFYALGDTRSPVMAAVASLAVNAAVGAALMVTMGHKGIALGTSLASVLNLVLLLRALRHRLGRLEFGRSAASYLRMILCAAAMGAGVYLLAQRVIPANGGGSMIPGLCVSIAGGVGFYGGLSLMSGSREMKNLLSMLSRRRR